LTGVVVVSLAEARELAAASRRMLAAGIDPLEAHRAERVKAEVAVTKYVTFKEAAERSTGKPGTAAQAAGPNHG
jgi:hypothetical protein